MSFEMEHELDAAYVMPTFGRSPVEFVSGAGMTLTDSAGREYLDFLAGIGVCSLGHGHPALTRALEEQAKKLLHVSNYFYVEHRGAVAALLSKLANGDAAGARELAEAVRSGDEQVVRTAAAPAEGEQVWQTFFANSGAEANECSMKLARLYAKRAGNGGNTIVCLRGGFHGRTLETLAATMQDRLQDAFRPLPGGFVACTPNDVDELRAIFGRLGSEVCAVMIEPIQGESGVHPLDAAFVRAAAELVHGVGGVLISDEVQAGVFRCGAPFAIQLAGVTPDIMSLAKGIAGGVPMGACVARAEVAQVFRPGDHGTTFGGSCLAVAAAEAVLCELVLGGYAERAREVGAYLAERLAELPHVVEVRGAGLMRGCDVDEAAGDAHDIVARALEAGAVINATGAHTLRFLPPLICTKADVDALMDVLAAVVI
ncbi:aminotransferase class III-fold pyridoxal phosphate-dependent enzyme [[Collinsella] massiliensis]|uniref:Aspartate aminotransferase family protein n=1 Tax=[Collinsella] massiliensis TaxID=1232426 RepID=A0A1Y3XXG4_9ACTN|nr:aminotransferase class III-fold pyridoxal phosphate-dependent enzyme [[Collinsella] massiliensis]OUN89811.1 aspartate aminotransferase family protein [[Collinsella] massiliensis]